MNDRSTRAHSLFIMTLKQSQPGNTSVTLNSRLFLADLGGSEQVLLSVYSLSVPVELNLCAMFKNLASYRSYCSRHLLL